MPGVTPELLAGRYNMRARSDYGIVPFGSITKINWMWQVVSSGFIQDIKCLDKQLFGI